MKVPKVYEDDQIVVSVGPYTLRRLKGSMDREKRADRYDQVQVGH